MIGVVSRAVPAFPVPSHRPPLGANCIPAVVDVDPTEVPYP